MYTLNRNRNHGERWGGGTLFNKHIDTEYCVMWSKFTASTEVQDEVKISSEASHCISLANITISIEEIEVHVAHLLFELGITIYHRKIK